MTMSIVIKHMGKVPQLSVQSFMLSWPSMATIFHASWLLILISRGTGMEPSNCQLDLPKLCDSVVVGRSKASLASDQQISENYISRLGLNEYKGAENKES